MGGGSWRRSRLALCERRLVLDIKWRRLVTAGRSVQLEFTQWTHTHELQANQCFNSAHTEHTSLSALKSTSRSGAGHTHAAMAGDGSDQRALQYEQTLVSWTCCLWTLFAEHTASFVLSSCGDREARLPWQILSFKPLHRPATVTTQYKSVVKQKLYLDWINPCWCRTCAPNVWFLCHSVCLWLVCFLLERVCVWRQREVKVVRF